MNKLVLLALMFLSAPAMAGTVYRCVGADGVPNYTSKRTTNAVCKAVAHSGGQSRLSGFSTKQALQAQPAPAAQPAAGAVAAPAAANPT